MQRIGDARPLRFGERREAKAALIVFGEHPQAGEGALQSIERRRVRTSGLCKLGTAPGPVCNKIGDTSFAATRIICEFQ